MYILGDIKMLVALACITQGAEESLTNSAKAVFANNADTMSSDTAFDIM